ncbi:MAG TPA: CGNR zinc finger domain-containing protein [Pseudolysinimonas sp.]|nr:CGNR zinc finger domain-containing protein [Pseudolysinimonas sp.]
MTRTRFTRGELMHPSNGVPWFFDAGSDSLEFAYSGDLGRGVAEWERLHTAHDLGAWLAARIDRVDAAEVSDRDLSDALELRSALTGLYLAAAAGGGLPADDIDSVNLYAATPDIPPALGGGRRQAGAGRIRVGQVLSTLARDAIEVFSNLEERRVRTCDDPTCRMVFHDESRTNNRRWCSMEHCGNRAKVRAHRERAAMRRHSDKEQTA